MMNIRNAAHDCHATAVKIDDKFKTWLVYCGDLHAACVDEQSSTDNQLVDNEQSLQVEKALEDSAKITVQDAQKASDKLGSALDEAQKAFRKASDEFPSGWDLIAQDLVKGIADAVLGAVNGAIGMLPGNIGKTMGGGSGGGGSAQPSQGDATGANPAPVLVPPRDPAYDEILKVMPYLNILAVIVNIDQGAINWAAAKGEEKPPMGADGQPKKISDGTSQETKKSIKFIDSMLKFAADSFAGVASDQQESRTLTSILSTCVQMVQEIEQAVEKAGDGDQDPVAPDAPEVKKWLSDFSTAYGQANKLYSTSQSLKGTAASGAPLHSNANPASKGAAASTTHGQAVLEGAKNRLKTTEEAFLSSQQNFDKASARLLDQKNRLADIHAELVKLTQANLTLKEIKKILINAIRLIVNMKQQISKLVTFFDNLANMVGLIVDNHVDVFLRTLQDWTTDNPGSENKEIWTVGDYTITDMIRTTIFNGACMIRGYFQVFGDIATMWGRLSTESIMPGINLCDELSTISASPDQKGQVNAKVAALEEWQTKARDQVAQLADSEQRRLRDGFAESIAQIEQDTKLLPATPAIDKAIKQGAETGKMQTGKEIDQQEQQDMTRFGGGLRDF